MSIYDLMSIGNNAMMNAKLGINVTSNNISNADTKGYARATVNYASRAPIMRNSLQFGTGAEAVNLKRHYNYFVEQQFLASNGQQQFWNAKAETLYSVESLFKQGEKNYGLSAALNKYFSSWNALTQDADSSAYRMELSEYSNTLATMLHTMNDSLKHEYEATNKAIELGVADANGLMKEIAELNRGIMEQPENLVLQDERDRKVRKLGELLPIKSIHQTDGSFSIITQAGQTLVDGVDAFELAQKGPEATANLASGSVFKGEIKFEGQSSKELKVEMVTAGPVGTAQYRVSIDGGKTWLTNENGEERKFTAGGADKKVVVNGVSIWFEDSTPATNLSVNDSFNIVAKDALYWKKTTAHFVNITPLGGYGNEEGRLSGGRLGGLLAARDSGIASYRERMDAFTKELIWQTNYQHSQGAGLVHYRETTSTNAVLKPTMVLNKSNLEYGNKITDGTLRFQMYTAQGAPDGSKLEIAITPGMTMQQLVDKINNTPAGAPKLQASLEGGRLKLKPRTAGASFEFAGDTSGVLAAVGLNTYFSGSGLADIALEARIKNDPKRINAAVVNGLGLVNSGDNTNAIALQKLKDKAVRLDTIHTSTAATFSKHLSSLTALVGSDMDGASRNKVYNETVSKDLEKRQQSEAGVNMDEELSNLTKFKHSFDAASKLITTANEMFDTILRLKS
ncbi:flagellar hook-associated protein FlgK [Halodesulfovibrio marinisediminis]|uniref:Flagellar hook-associated protein 1 n=1 Tax=Halodesulfovibrio marinisediminis DSM 17456 TaxID=1121457 RepID=A0A1N6DS36_9BACT|nr:flagellar basal body rod C-terminal domain-containing protein [Halodesulfovibrio marinisediminis]SIN73599.1 flagellar hook-associated protein 1 FlgK [Halodesulfovibrio marinisediminis DSM 17456]